MLRPAQMKKRKTVVDPLPPVEMKKPLGEIKDRRLSKYYTLTPLTIIKLS